MSALEDVEEFIRLVRANGGIAHVQGGCEEEFISRAEADLGVRFPPPYVRFLRSLGECDIAGGEFYGVWRRGDEFYGADRGHRAWKFIQNRSEVPKWRASRSAVPALIRRSP